MEICQIKKAKEILPRLVYKQGESKEILQALQTALACLEALLNAGEVFLPLLTGKETSEFNEPISENWVEAYNKARSEDIAVLAKRLLSLEQMIGDMILFDYEEIEPDGDGEGFHQIIVPVPMKDFLSKNPEFIKALALAITESLKGVEK